MRTTGSGGDGASWLTASTESHLTQLNALLSQHGLPLVTEPAVIAVDGADDVVPGLCVAPLHKTAEEVSAFLSELACKKSSSIRHD